MPQHRCPRESARQHLSAARGAGDRRREAASLADLGLMHLFEGDIPQAVALLEDALALARQLGDPSAQGDVLGHLGMATAAAGQPQRALALLEQELALACATSDRFAEKAALAHLGLTLSRERDPARALAFFSQALALARELGDWHHEADLLWYVAIQHAALGQRDQALAHAQAAVDLLQSRCQSQAAWFAHHLQTYRGDETGGGQGATSATGPIPPPPTSLGGVIVPTSWEARLRPPPAEGPAAGGARLLDRAFAAARSMAQFLGSGLKTAPAETRRQRLQACGACAHHTGLRCRLCGCFTGPKAALAHEACPIGKW
jgi:tetratricopeptide (TPR) repeat protein